jgi:hypothetical protein
VAEAQEQFGKPEEGERLPLEAWKPLPINDSEDVTLDNSVCV